MNEYTVYFQIFGKKLKVRVKAETEDAARYQVQKALQIEKVTKYPVDTWSSLDEAMNDMFKSMGVDPPKKK